MDVLTGSFSPLVIVVAIVALLLRKGLSKRREEDMVKTSLPGRTDGEVIPVWESTPAPPVQKAAKNKQQPLAKPLRTPVNIPVAPPSTPIVAEIEETAYEPVLNIENMDDIKKAVIYTEIFYRKEY